MAPLQAQNRNVSTGPNVLHANGYTQAHSQYNKDLDYHRTAAFEKHSGSIGSVNFTLAHLRPGSNKHQKIGIVSQVVPSVYVHSSAPQLLERGLKAIQPMYEEQILSYGFAGGSSFPLMATDVTICDKNRAPMDMEADGGVIASHYYFVDKAGNRTRFKPNALPFQVLLLVNHRWYRRFEEWMSEQEIRMNQQETDDERLVQKPRKRSGKTTSRTTVPIDDDDSMPEVEYTAGISYRNTVSLPMPTPGPSFTSHTPNALDAPQQQMGTALDPLSAHTPGCSMSAGPEHPLPNVSDIRIALSQQTGPTPKEAFGLVGNRYVNVTLQDLRKDITVQELTVLAQEDNRFGVFEEPRFVRLKLDFSLSISGAFKRAIFGQLLASGQSEATAICAKQAVYMKDGSLKLYPSKDQTRLLAKECLLMAWGNALGRMAFDVRATALKSKPDGYRTRLAIPDVQFVGTALAVEQGEQDRAKIYLVEEFISSTFRKYIHNSTAKISRDASCDPDELRIALYLSFCQHAQYLYTGGNVFVSDYQGGPFGDGSDLVLLTDPQIMTHPSLGRVFADGNVQSSFLAFPREHQCNEFCEDLGLEPFVTDDV
ncbi:hypothetical protein GGX14DRAFT_627855 [Mycena pura]|uniref:Alpha-type protein kinase domain-containing protein n=1 Tax=Mycena pura TaxID=153505 RepID=A0AAD6YR83_9AGAR|nr:hypothetical protein GGX14DRAFT_627855 [Mycena pura]